MTADHTVEDVTEHDYVVDDSPREDSFLRSKTHPLWPLLLLVTLETSLTGVLIRNSYFFADDILTFGFAHQEGWSWGFVFKNVYGHIAPIERLTHLIALDLRPMSFWLGGAMILFFYAALLLALVWVLRELQVQTAVALTILFVIGISTCLINEAMYFDQTVFLFPASTFMLLVLALYLRWNRTGINRYLYFSWGMFALAFASQERPLVVLVYLVILRYLVLPYRLAPGAKRPLWGDWRLWLPYALVGGAYTGYYLTIAPNRHTSLSTTITFFRLAIGDMLRILLGTPAQGTPAALTWLLIIAALGFLLTAIMLARRAPILLRSSLFFAACFCVNLYAVVQGIGGVFGAKGVAGQVQYYVDALTAVGISVGLMASPWVTGRVGMFRNQESAVESGPILITRGGHRRARRGAISAAALCLAVVVAHSIALPYGLSNVAAANSSMLVSRNWVSSLRGSLRRLDADHTKATLVPLTLPAYFVPGFEAPFNLEAPFLQLLPEWHPSDTGVVKMIGPNGSLLDARAGEAESLVGDTQIRARVTPYNAKVTFGPNGTTCVAIGRSGGAVAVTLPQPLSGSSVLAVDVHTYAKRMARGWLVAINGRNSSYNEIPTYIRPGNHRVVEALNAQTIRAFAFADLSGGTQFCVSSIEVGQLEMQWPNRTCNLVNSYGTPMSSVPCGRTWR